MTPIFKIQAFILISLLAISCASVSKAPEAHSMEAKTLSTPDDKGTVIIYRTGRVVGATGQLQVKINGIAAGGTGPGTFFRWDLKPGSYTFLSSTSESSAVVQLDVKAGERYFIRQDARIGFDSGRVTMKEVGDKKGESEVEDCKLLVSSYIAE